MPVYEGPSWNLGTSVTTVTWSFATSNYNLSSTYSGYASFDSSINDSYKATVRAAFATWSAVANINFVEVADSTSSDVRLGNKYIDGNPTSGGSTLAETLYWYHGSAMDTTEIYFDSDAYNGSNFLETATHEIGHAIGLGHSSSPTNVMYYLTTSQNISGKLSADDILGVQTLYGARATSGITGTSGPDTFTSTAANDVYNGAGGVDTVVYAGSRAQYTVTGNTTSMTVADSLGSRNGTDTLSNVEQLKFSDVTLAFDLTSSQDKLVYLLYQAAYARMPDLTGFRYWAGVADTNNTSGIKLADAFMAAPEFTTKYGASPTNAAFVNSMYGNILGRTPDQAGLDYWTGQLNSGMARDQLLVSFATSNENITLTGSHTSNGYWLA
jgi:hypothetical protein